MHGNPLQEPLKSGGISNVHAPMFNKLLKPSRAGQGAAERHASNVHTACAAAPQSSPSVSSPACHWKLRSARPATTAFSYSASKAASIHGLTPRARSTTAWAQAK